MQERHALLIAASLAVVAATALAATASAGWSTEVSARGDHRDNFRHGGWSARTKPDALKVLIKAADSWVSSRQPVRRFALPGSATPPTRCVNADGTWNDRSTSSWTGTIAFPASAST